MPTENTYGLISSNDKKKLDNIVIIEIPITLDINSTSYTDYNNKDIYDYIMSLDLSTSNIIVRFTNYTVFVTNFYVLGTGEGPARILYGIIRYYDTNYDISIAATPEGIGPYHIEISYSKLLTYTKLRNNVASFNGGGLTYSDRIYITISDSRAKHFKFSVGTSDEKYAEINICSSGKGTPPQIYLQNGINMKFKIHVYYKDGYIKYIEYENNETNIPALTVTNLCEHPMTVSKSKSYTTTGYNYISKSSDSGSSGESSTNSWYGTEDLYNAITTKNDDTIYYILE